MRISDWSSDVCSSDLVDDLETRGLVKRQPHPADRRAKLVSLTAAGRRQLAVAQKIIDAPPEALMQLPAKPLATLRQVLEKIEACDAQRQARVLPRRSTCFTHNKSQEGRGGKTGGRS